jgi:hypothetical protein
MEGVMELWLLIPGIIVMFFAAFTILWMLVLAMISSFGGWKKASREHPKRNITSSIVEQYSFQSVIFNMIGNYRSCINVFFYPEGIELKPIFIFSFFHKPIFILWNEMQNVTRKGFLFYKGINIKTHAIEIFISGQSAEKIAERFSL